MAKCPECGTEVAEKHRFCMACGAEVRAAQGAQGGPEPPEAAAAAGRSRLTRVQPWQSPSDAVKAVREGAGGAVKTGRWGAERPGARTAAVIAVAVVLVLALGAAGAGYLLSSTFSNEQAEYAAGYEQQARSIASAAQAELSARVAAGRLETPLKDIKWLQKCGYGSDNAYIDARSATEEGIVAFGSCDPDAWDEEYVIEVDPESAEVTRVFYSERFATYDMVDEVCAGVWRTGSDTTDEALRAKAAKKGVWILDCTGGGYTAQRASIDAPEVRCSKKTPRISIATEYVPEAYIVTVELARDGGRARADKLTASLAGWRGSGTYAWYRSPTDSLRFAETADGDDVVKTEKSGGKTTYVVNLEALCSEAGCSLRAGDEYTATVQLIAKNGSTASDKVEASGVWPEDEEGF